MLLFPLDVHFRLKSCFYTPGFQLVTLFSHFEKQKPFSLRYENRHIYHLQWETLLVCLMILSHGFFIIFFRVFGCLKCSMGLPACKMFCLYFRQITHTSFLNVALEMASKVDCTRVFEPLYVKPISV